MTTNVHPPDADHRVADLSWQMSGVTDRSDLFAGMAMMLDSVLRSDRVSWSHLDLRPDTISYAGPTKDWASADEIGQQLTALYRGHPIIMSMFPGVDRTHGLPRRTSDLISRRELKKTRVYAELLHPHGSEWQMTVRTDLDLSHGITGMTGSCWVFDRTRHDYTDNEVELASRLQTVLTLFEHTLAFRARAAAESDEALRYGLTGREIEVLGLVAQGCTAHAIADYMRITEATVRKHLENAYRKLGVGDRLLAVDAARRLGLIGS